MGPSYEQRKKGRVMATDLGLAATNLAECIFKGCMGKWAHELANKGFSSAKRRFAKARGGTNFGEYPAGAP
jgi:hypothetical protein